MREYFLTHHLVSCKSSKFDVKFVVLEDHAIKYFYNATLIVYLQELKPYYPRTLTKDEQQFIWFFDYTRMVL